MEKFKKILGIVFFVFLLVSCSKESEPTQQGIVNLKAKAIYANTTSKLVNDVVITSFKVNIRKIEFEFFDSNESNSKSNNDDNDDQDDSIENEVKVYGPWELDLLNQTMPIVSVSVPNGIYEEIEFKISPSLDLNSPIYGKSIEIKGTINGVPFVYFSADDHDFSIDYNDAIQNLVVENGIYDVVFNFDLNQVINSINLSNAVDGNEDGLIEIGMNDPDGNSALANLFDEHIKSSCELEDEHEDENEHD